MGSGRRSAVDGNTSSAATLRGSATCSPVSGDLYTLFHDSFHDTLLDAFIHSGVARRHGINREQLVEVARLPISEHFHNYLCCSICYENALICVVGTCTHVMCFLCFMRLKNFYKEECDVYQCPYCKQASDCLVICANPIFVHRCVEPSFYKHEGAPELSKSRLEELLRIMALDASVDRKFLSQPDVNIKDVHAVFLESANSLKRRIWSASDMKMHCLSQKMQKLSMDKKAPRDCFRSVYTAKHAKPRLEGEYVVLGDHRLIFENPGIYMLFRVVTSALCWMPECKSLWYTPMPMLTVGDMTKAMDKIYKHRSMSYDSLNKHLKGRHGVVFCETCQDHFSDKKFICEMALYQPEDIKKHIKLGDLDRVPSVPAHVLCSACRRFQWDRSELKKHAKDEHFFCNICDSEGWVCDVFTDYPSIFSHFKTYHYPCEEDNCLFVVFRDDLQLQLHYMSKHPQRHRSSVSRKLKPQPQSQPTETSTSVPVTYNCDVSFSLNSVPWDGTIRIINDEVPVKACHQPLPKEEIISAEFEKWLRKSPYLSDPAFQGYSKINALLEAFTRGLIRVNLGSTKYVFDFDTFNVKCATRVLNDLKNVLEMLKSSSFPPRCELWTLLPGDFHSRSQQVLHKLEFDYKSFVEASLSGEVPADGSMSLIDLVKQALSFLVVFLYNINVHTEFDGLLCYVKASSLQYNISPNALMLLNLLEDMVPMTNRILLKQSLDWLIKTLESMLTNASEGKQAHASLSSMVKKTKVVADFQLDMLDPGSDLTKATDRQKKGKRLQPIIKKQTNISRWNVKVKSNEPDPAPAVISQSSTSPSSPEAPGEKPQSPVIENESYTMSVEDAFKKNLHTNFYSVMVNVIRNALMANESKYNASSPGYRLRDTTRMKINQLATSGNRRFTALSEFVPMQTLESLQALEPEFHRLVKEAKRLDNIDALAKTWSSRCAYVLRRCRVEHLEVIDYYLNTNAAAMALRSDVEFPSLGNQGIPQPLRPRSSYAQALNVPNTSAVVFLESEFPALG
ncbi:hypothetical protein X943_000628 [Babesia divergens]|uniref:RING-type domain-containing protein n=1 Tax=Babesia divergens TaxID=32595 RepID=A0AAD9LGJ7_BABDI|nr:hypothetical protein X943_000628 [Babesia divergens]